MMRRNAFYLTPNAVLSEFKMKNEQLNEIFEH
jgi:hypothetical protein